MLRPEPGSSIKTQVFLTGRLSLQPLSYLFLFLDVWVCMCVYRCVCMGAYRCMYMCVWVYLCLYEYGGQRAAYGEFVLLSCVFQGLAWIVRFGG